MNQYIMHCYLRTGPNVRSDDSRLSEYVRASADGNVTVVRETGRPEDLRGEPEVVPAVFPPVRDRAEGRGRRGARAVPSRERASYESNRYYNIYDKDSLLSAVNSVG